MCISPQIKKITNTQNRLKSTFRCFLLNSCCADLTVGLIHSESGNEYLITVGLNIRLLPLFQ